MESKGRHTADAGSTESTVEYIVEQSKISLKSTKSNLEFTLSLSGIRGGAVIQATGRTELEDGTRPGGRLNRLHAHCGVCTSPTVMLNPLWGMAWL